MSECVCVCAQVWACVSAWVSGEFESMGLNHVHVGNGVIPWGAAVASLKASDTST